MTIRSIEHVAIAVHDVEAAKRMYSRLGFMPQWLEELPTQGMRSHVLRSEEVYLELLESMALAGGSSALDRFLARHGEGLHHICLRVSSLEESIRQMDVAGLRLVNREPVSDEQGRRVFVHPAGTHGVLIGLVELHEGLVRR